MLKCQEEINCEIILLLSLISLYFILTSLNQPFSRSKLYFHWFPLSHQNLSTTLLPMKQISPPSIVEAMSDCGHLDTLAEITTCINDILTGNDNQWQSYDINGINDILTGKQWHQLQSKDINENQMTSKTSSAAANFPIPKKYVTKHNINY